MPTWKNRLATYGLAALVLGLGVGAFLLLWWTAPSPAREDRATPPRMVRAFVAEPGRHLIAIDSFGQSRAADEWDARAEVEGTIEFLYDEFDDGHVVPANTVLARIDDTDFQLALRQARAEVKAEEAQLRELAQREENARAILELRRSQLKFADDERARSKLQLEQGLVTPAVHEKVESAYVDRLSTLRDLENELELIPVQRDLRTASLEGATIRVDRAQRDVDRCAITSPDVPMLCVGTAVELFEKVDKGQTLGQFMGLARAEVLAMVEPRKALMLFPNAKSDFYGSIDLTSELFNDVIRERLNRFVVHADVTWRVGDGSAQWRGRATRVSAVVDERTRTAPAVIEIEDAFTDIRPGVRPALVPGMFLEVTLYGDTLEGVFVVPRDALRDGQVYVEREGKLEIRKVHIVALEDDVAVIDTGLAAGDHVILTDLFPAANGMHVASEIVPAPIPHRAALPELHSDLTPAESRTDEP